MTGEPRFAITGTGRCGTTYMAYLLRSSGVNCGHEQWWTPDPERVTPGLDGDSSWMALPEIESGEWSGPVLHITRHPVDTVRSLRGIRFFRFPGYARFREIAYEYEPALRDLPPLEAAVSWWNSWNRRCAAVADLTVKVEDVLHHLDEIGDLFGVQLDPAASAEVPPNTNTRRREDIDPADIWPLVDDPFGYAP
jgi:hypothetical protein